MLKNLSFPFLTAVVFFATLVVYKRGFLVYLICFVLPVVSWFYCKKVLNGSKYKLFFGLYNGVLMASSILLYCNLNPYDTLGKEFLLPAALIFIWSLLWSVLFLLGKPSQTANIIKLNALIFGGAICTILYQEFFLLVDFLGPADLWCIMLLPYAVIHFLLAERFAKDKGAAHLILFSMGFVFLMFFTFFKYFPLS